MIFLERMVSTKRKFDSPGKRACLFRSVAIFGFLVAFLAPVSAQEAADEPAEVAEEATGETPEPAETTGVGLSAAEQEEGFEALEQIAGGLDPSNGMVRVLTVAADNPVVGEVWEDHHDTLIKEMLAAGLRAFIPLVVAMGIVLALGLFVAAWLTSKLFVPKRATVLNAAKFAAVPVVVVGIGVIVMMFGSYGFLVIATPMLGIVLLFSLAAATMYIYDVDFLKMILIAIVGFIVSNVVTGVLWLVVSFIFFQQMVGPVFGTLAYVFAENATPYVTGEVEELHPQRDKLQEQLDEQKQKLAGLQGELQNSQEEVKKSQAAVESKRQSPELVYTAVGQLVDQGKMDEAIVGYAEFGAKFSGHPLAEKATDQIRALEAQKAQSEADREAARKARIEAEKQRVATFRQKLSDGKATLSEIRKNLLGKERPKVIELLGSPDQTGANVLIYRNVKVFDPVRDQDREFLVNFLEGRVHGVNYLK